MPKLNKVESRQRRHFRVLAKVRGTAERPRLLVRKSLKHIYAQVLDDSGDKGSTTLLALSTSRSAPEGSKKSFRNTSSAKTLGVEVGNQLKARGIATIVFDRGGYRYHGCVKALADAVREAGIKF